MPDDDVLEEKNEIFQPPQKQFKRRVIVRTHKNPNDEQEVFNKELIITNQEGSDIIHSDGSNAESATYFDMVVRVGTLNYPDGLDLAIVGGGLMYLPRMLSLKNWTKMDIYELEQSLKDRADNRYPELSASWNWIIGDYLQTMTGLYDLIIYDIDEPPDKVLLRSHLKEGGRIMYFENFYDRRKKMG